MLSFCLFCFFGDSNTQRSKARNRKSVRVDGTTKKLFSGLSKKRTNSLRTLQVGNEENND